MSENQQDKENGKNRQINSYVKFSGMAFQMVVVIGLFTYAGYKIDAGAHHAVKWVTAVLSLAAVFVSLYLVIKSLKD